MLVVCAQKAVGLICSGAIFAKCKVENWQKEPKSATLQGVHKEWSSQTDLQT